MKKLLIMLTILTCLTLLILQAQAQEGRTYTWGKPQAVTTPIVGQSSPNQSSATSVTVQPFPDVTPRTRILHRPTMRPIRKVTWPVCETWMPAPPTPIYVSPPTYVAIDAKMAWQKIGLSFHRDELGLSGTTPLGEFGIALVDPKAFKIRYSVTTQQTQTDNLIPTTAVQIGATQLVQAQASIGQAAPLAGAAAAGTPIKLDWQFGPSHRIDAICVRTNQGPQQFWLNPAIVANWIPFTVTGTTTTGTFNNFYWGGGMEMVYQQPYSRLTALVAGSDKYLMADCSLAYSVGSNLDIVAGWQGKQLKMDRNTIARITAPSLGMLVRF
jgi:hypothetical protein